MKLSEITSHKSFKTWLVLGVALLIGLLAAWGAQSYLQNEMAQLSQRSRGGEVQVVVATSDLPKGTTISSANVAVRSIPTEYAHSGAVSPEQFSRVDGQAIGHSVKTGEMLMWALMENKRAPSFSARLEPGRRAITVPVDEINSISGLLEPGDRIDLLVTLEHKGEKMTVPLLQKVTVMATGQRVVDDPKGGEQRLYSTVTLDTTPDNAQTVVLARERGRLTAMLRHPQDESALRRSSVDVLALLNATPKITSNARVVPVLFGNRTGSFTPEALELGAAEPSRPTLKETP
jgi:pilus assembly protein CpaB